MTKGLAIQIGFAISLAFVVLVLGSPVVLAQKENRKDTSANFIYYQRCIFIKMQANETEDLLFLLDTGASASAIDLQTAEKLKLSFRGTSKIEGTTGVIEAKNTLLKKLSFGKATAKNLSIPARNLKGSLVPPGMRLDGIVGYDFLRFFSVQIDFLNRIISFSPKAEKDSANRQITSIPFTLDNGIPRLKAILNGSLAADFRLDTGASIFETSDIYLNITENTWERLIALDPELKPERYFRAGGIGKEVKLPVARIKSFAIGAISFPKPFVIVQPQLGYFARLGAVGFISNNLLEKFSPVTIDYIKHNLYLHGK